MDNFIASVSPAEIIVSLYHPSMFPLYVKFKPVLDSVFVKTLDEVTKKLYLHLSEIQKGLTVEGFALHCESLGFSNSIKNNFIELFKKYMELTDDDYKALEKRAKNFVCHHSLQSIIAGYNEDGEVEAVIKKIKELETSSISSDFSDETLFSDKLFGEINVEDALDTYLSGVIKSSLGIINVSSGIGGYIKGQMVVFAAPAKCFVGETKVMTLDGKYRTLKELYESKETNIPVYCYDFAENTYKVSYAERCDLRGYVNKLYKITFDTGTTIQCTPDHLFPLLTGETVKAEELVVGDCLLPINRRHQYLDLQFTHQKIEPKDLINNEEYEVVYGNTDYGINNAYTHRLVAHRFFPDFQEHYGVIHHDLHLGNGRFDKRNNLPQNLKYFKSNKEHWQYHKKILWKHDYEYMKKFAVKNLPDSLSLTLEEIKDAAKRIRTVNIKALSKELHCSASAIRSRIYANYKTHEDFAKSCGFLPWEEAHGKEKISKEDLINIAIACQTYKPYILSKESGHTHVNLKIAIKRYFGDLHGFAHFLGFTYRDGYLTNKNLSLDRLNAEIKRIGKSVTMEDLMLKFNTKRQTIVHFLYQNGLTYKELLATNGIELPSIQHIVSAMKRLNTANPLLLAQEFETSAEAINSIMSAEGWSPSTLASAYNINYNNHRVIRIDTINAPNTPVYDLIEVKDYHNYAVQLEGDENTSSGIITFQCGKSMISMGETVNFIKQNLNVLYAAFGDLKDIDFLYRMCAQINHSPMPYVCTPQALASEVLLALQKVPQLKTNLRRHLLAPDKFSAEQYVNLIKTKTNPDGQTYYDWADVIIVDYDSNLKSDADSMYAKGENIYQTLYQLVGIDKLIIVLSQTTKVSWDSEIIDMAEISESSRKQQIIDVLVTVSHPVAYNKQNHVGKLNLCATRRGTPMITPYFRDIDGNFHEVTEETYEMIKSSREPKTFIKDIYKYNDYISGNYDVMDSDLDHPSFVDNSQKATQKDFLPPVEDNNNFLDDGSSYEDPWAF